MEADRMLAGRQHKLVLHLRAFAEAKWQGMIELSGLVLKLHRLRVTSVAGLPVSDCNC